MRKNRAVVDRYMVPFDSFMKRVPLFGLMIGATVGSGKNILRKGKGAYEKGMLKRIRNRGSWK